MSLLLWWMACTGPTSKPSGDTDTSADSADSVADTAETADTHDTVVTDSGESGDTEDTWPYTPWNPGEDIPGWEDADCTEAHPGRTYVIEYPDVYTVQGTFLNGLPGAGPHLFDVRLRDCAHYPCLPDSLDETIPFVHASLDATAGDDGLSRGTGTWGPDDEGLRQVTGSGRSALIDWSNDRSIRVPAMVSTCIERMRPDEVRGAVRVEVTADVYPYDIVYYYESLVYRFPFTVSLPDHAGFDASQPDVPADQPLEYATAHYTYEQPYDDAWPWDDITDPSIREQLYERYTPYNAP